MYVKELALFSLTYTLVEVDGVFTGDHISDGRALRAFLWGLLLGGSGRHCETAKIFGLASCSSRNLDGSKRGKVTLTCCNSYGRPSVDC